MFTLHDPLDEAVRGELAAYDDLSAALLARRGVATREDAERFLNPSYDDHLHDPLAMADMGKAARRLARAIGNGEHIAIWTDYDCDGGPAAVLLYDFLRKAGATFENYIPHRHLEGYGLNIPGIEKLAARGTTLIVTADVGITDNAPVARANELGIDVIVTDHHLPGEHLPDAYAVVDPNARANEPYPFRGLCGAGVAWKLVVATLAVSPELRGAVPDGWEKWLLDMVGLATIADMVPLADENRVLAKYGLVVMRKSPRLGLRKLCAAMRVEQRALSEDDVAFMLAPRVNAASRMLDPRVALELFTTDDAARAERLANELEAANRKRKAEAGAITRAAHARLKEHGEVREVIVLGDPSWRPALLGLVANGLADEYERPVFLWGREGSGAMKGSVRSGGYHALELMQAADGVFDGFGGHAASGGFTVREDAVFDLEARLTAALAKLAPRAEADEFEDRADAALTLDEATLELLERLDRLAPYGEQNPKPVFAFRDSALMRVTRFGKGNEHLKLSLASPETGRTLDAVAFFAKPPLTRALGGVASGARLTVLAHLERDSFSRRQPLRLRLLDVKVA